VVLPQSRKSRARLLSLIISMELAFFLQTLMKDFGGDIACHSEHGDYIEFVLTFPKVVAEKSEAKS
jgi:hypothetical protein